MRKDFWISLEPLDTSEKKILGLFFAVRRTKNFFWAVFYAKKKFLGSFSLSAGRKFFLGVFFFSLACVACVACVAFVAFVAILKIHCDYAQFSQFCLFTELSEP